MRRVAELCRIERGVGSQHQLGEGDASAQPHRSARRCAAARADPKLPRVSTRRFIRETDIRFWLHLLPSPSTDGARRPRDAAARHTAPGASSACQGHIPSISDSPRTPWDRYACRTRTPATSSPPPIECRLAGESRSRWTLAAPSTRHSTQQLVRDLGAVRVLINERDALRRSLAQSEARLAVEQAQVAMLTVQRDKAVQERDAALHGRDVAVATARGMTTFACSGAAILSSHTSTRWARCFLLWWLWLSTCGTWLAPPSSWAVL